ncbi:MAG: hypothetical protein KC652_18375 [Cyanobacteria bacterium HKST-UBA01]|nr:hypothetical protein [Cyanobacteria bacterium HKST-UBA01]
MSTVELKLTEGQIQNAIAVAISESFTPERRDELLRDAIRAHLTVKASSYDKETLFSATVNKQLREMVGTELEKEVQKMRPELEALVKKYFHQNIQSDILCSIEKQLAEDLTKNIKVNVYYKESY